MGTSASVVDSPVPAPVPAGPARPPNISPPGRRRRRRFGISLLMASLALFGAFIAFHAPWYVRLLVFLPAAGSAMGFLQMARNTCILRAQEGTYEHDDGTMTPAPAADVRASR